MSEPITVARLREILADKPDEAVVVFMRFADMPEAISMVDGSHYHADTASTADNIVDPSADSGWVPCVRLWPT